MGVSRPILAIVAAVSLAAALPAAVEAEPVHRTVGNYTLTVYYARDPPYLEDTNSLIVEVLDGRTGTPVAGLERTLRIQGSVTVIVGVIQGLDINLRPYGDRLGVYEGVFVTPAIGTYMFRVFGTIEGMPVDETFTTGDGGLAEVEVPPRDYTSPGAILVLGVLGVYLLSIAIVAGWQLAKRTRSTSPRR